ncbi:MAG: Stp1/IreP family PP2C-type Ser/Thr phosphatase [Clostridia bacterium]|nr:Stp1/IreP family PP2C-type Ser/Thr phosphatase [Clostridia bacterium]
MKVYSKTDVGRRRTVNQDAYLTGEFDNGAVYAVVCDGMGGAKGGNIASEKAATIISDYIVKSYSPKMSSVSVENLLRAAVESANTEVFELARSDEQYEGMGTTVVVVLVIDNLAHIVHVGDSRAYFIGNGTIERITEDHSMVQFMVNNGEISESEAKHHPKKNIITRAVGAEETVLCDYDIVLKPENTSILVCTDGLSNCVDEQVMLQVITSGDGEDRVERLIELANNAGGPDNITAVLIS